MNVLFYPYAQFQESWWLLAPITVRRFYRSRRCGASIGNACKSNRVSATLKLILGLRGLRLKVDIANRTGRLSLAFTMACCNSAAEHARRDLEIPRRLPRHGSCRTLGVLYLPTPGRFSKKRGGGQGCPSSRLHVRGRPCDFRGRGLSRWARSFGRRLSGVLVSGEYLRLRMDRVKANGVSTTYRQSHGIGEVEWCNKLRPCATRCVVALGST